MNIDAKKTKIYTIFLYPYPYSHPYPLIFPYPYPLGSPPIKQKVLSNEEILREIEARCEDVEFVGRVNLVDEERWEKIKKDWAFHYGMTQEEKRFRAETLEIARKKAEYAVKNVRNLRGELDGVLVFGPASDELISTNLPIIVAIPMWGQFIWFGERYVSQYAGKKVLTTRPSVIYDKDKSVFSARVEDLVGKIRLIQALSKMKGLRVLNITDQPVLGSYETGYGDREDYEKVYLNNLEETFGVKFITIPQEELFEKTNRTDEEEARKVAEKWITEAKEVKTTKDEVVKSAKLYLAMEDLMKKYNAQAITTEGYDVFISYEKGPIPADQLAHSEFLTNGIVTVSECLIDCVILQQLGLYIWGRPGFVGDYEIDPFNNLAMIMHCECMFNPYGDDRRVPYTIRNLPFWKENEGGAAVTVDLPIGEVVTVAKISIHDKKLAVFAGKAISGEDYYGEFEDLMCRTKLAIKVQNAWTLWKNHDIAFGEHRIVWYGDYRERLKDLATLIGFKVLEDDKENPA